MSAAATIDGDCYFARFAEDELGNSAETLPQDSEYLERAKNCFLILSCTQGNLSFINIRSEKSKRVV